MTIVEILNEIDQQLFIFIHASGAMPFLDPLLLAIRHAYTWIPLYALVLFWLIKYYRQYTILFLAGTLLTFAITDYGSASILKPYFARLRPCYSEAMKPYLRELLACGGKWSMPSSHASNHFGLAAFWFWTSKTMGGKQWSWVWLWALLIGYAQVYVGKHYPFDIVVGAVFGTLAGWCVAKLFKWWQARRKQIISG